MADYFSSFRQQTGVSIESDIEPKGRSLRPSSSEFGGGDHIAPIEVTEIKQVDSGSGAPAEDPAGQPRKETAPPPRVPAPEPLTRPASNETATTGRTLHGIFQPSRGRLENIQMTARPEPGQPRCDSQENPPKDLSRANGPSERIPPMEVTVERKAAAAKADRPLRRSPTPDKQASDRTQTPQDQARPHEPIRQRVLKQVRRWVASQPVLTTEQQRSRVTTKVADELEQALQKAPGEKRTAAPGTTGKQITGEPETAVHDLHLSIGPLNITVEQPELDKRRTKPQPRREGRAASESGTSRLRRHYIRI